MNLDAEKPATPRPQHRRNASSKSNILRAFVPSKSSSEKTQKVPLKPTSDDSRTKMANPLTERGPNVQLPLCSPSKTRPKSIDAAKLSDDKGRCAIPQSANDASKSPHKSKSSTNLGAVFSKMNRSSKDVSQLRTKDKENTTPPTSAHASTETPIWAQFATTAKLKSRPTTRDGETKEDVYAQIARYTPQQYSPSKQRNFGGDIGVEHTAPTLAKRPQSIASSYDVLGAISRRISVDRNSFAAQDTAEGASRKSVDSARLFLAEKVRPSGRNNGSRKTSGSSTEQGPAKERLTIAKRGGRVMAAVAALQAKTRSEPTPKPEPVLDSDAVNKAFEAVLDARNIPEPMRQKMRSLTLRVKADFVKQDQAGTTPPNSATVEADATKVEHGHHLNAIANDTELDDDLKSAKRSRPRSRTFTFSKGDKRTEESSPSKKRRSRSKNRPVSTYTPDYNDQLSGTDAGSTSSNWRKSRTPAKPSDFIVYLREHRDPCVVEIGRVHKLRILLRNETVAWVNQFVSLGGMDEIVGLLHRIMEVEWREEHEDQLLHETLLCLKGLCTTERAMAVLDKVADQLFPALISMLYDDEKKGPAEYATRTIITILLFNYLQSATDSPAEVLEQRAYRILGYVGEPSKPEDARPVGFVLDMHISRPYKLWCREVTNVTKEVFWIFLHRLNVVPLPVQDENTASESSRAATYTKRHFPGTRPPVPAAPYIGGVEWDATTYITSHLDLLNGLLASIRTADSRNAVRTALRDSGFERTFGASLRTCKEKFYSGVHDGLRAWVAAAAEDGWDTQLVREGPTLEEQAARARSCSPKKMPKEKAPQLDAPCLDMPKLEVAIEGLVNHSNEKNDDGEDWLG